MGRYILFIGCFFLSYIGVAQPISSNTYEDMLETADSAVADNNYFNAIEWYEKAYKEQRDPAVAIAIGDLYAINRVFDRAESWYKRILRRDKDGELVDLRFDYARILKSQGKYQEALNELNQFLSLSEDEELKNEGRKVLAGIEMIPNIPENIDAVIVYGGNDLNCPSGDYSPALYNDGSLYFSSFNTRKEIELGGEEEDYHAKIYVAQRNKNGQYEDPEPLGQQINRKGFHNANVSFSKDGRSMYFTRMKLEGSEIALSELYRSNRTDDGWGPAEFLTDLNGDFRVKHPVEGELFGNRVLFFVSDMEGGYGGDDIYYSTIRGDGFSTAVNLGETINTERDEITPFYRDGTLYFSSKGYPSLGGFDIYFSSWDGSSWSNPENIGHNYNSSYDDTYFSFNESGTMGFLVSNRPAKDKRNLKGKTCCDDIFTISIRDVVIDLIALVEDENGPLNGALLELIDESVDGGNISTKSNPTGNNFSFLLDPDHNYLAKVTREGYFPDSFTFNTVGILDDYTVKKTVVLNPKPKEEEETETVSINEPIRLSDIYYDFEDDKILPEAEPSLEYLTGLMNQYPDMVIELSSHTDSRGLSRYNQDLSQRRAESARLWLLDAGISPDRIVAKGYGESQILNRCVDGVRCPEEEHRINRRTEFKIIAGPTSIEIKKSITKGTRKQEGGN